MKNKNSITIYLLFLLFDANLQKFDTIATIREPIAFNTFVLTAQMNAISTFHQIVSVALVFAPFVVRKIKTFPPKLILQNV